MGTETTLVLSFRVVPQIVLDKKIIPNMGTET